MENHEVVRQLEATTGELHRGIGIEWHYPPKTPRRPLAETMRKSWPVFRPGQTGPWKKNGKNWFYGELVLPKTFRGVNVQGAEALVTIPGWMPFTLWLDGQELFREEHAWMATGPIVEPVPMPVRPGRKHRFILCVEPTELPENSLSAHVDVTFRPCVELAVEVGAAAAQLRYAQALTRTAAEKRRVEKAAAAVDSAALKGPRWARVIASIKKMEEILEPFSARAREMTVHLLGHSHIDMDWMWTWPDTVHCVRHDFKAVTDMMDENPELTFTHSQVPTYEVTRKMDPAVFRKVRQRVAEGRWENAAGTWVEGDLNMADGESVARHMLYAADWTKAHLGSKSRVLWEPDTFGHPGNMPQLARLAELDCYFHSRCNPGRHDRWPFRLWEGIDGSTVPALSLHYNSTLQPEQTILAALQSLRFGLRTGLHVWGVGDHGGALSRLQLGILAAYRNKPVMPTFQFSTTVGVLEALRKERARLPRNRGETFHVFEGCFTTHASIKKYNRDCEAALLTAETLAALAGLDRNDALRGAWTPTLFNHFHDIFDGAAVHDTYINAHRRAEKSLRTARKVAKEAAAVLVKPAAGGGTLVVTNPLGFERTEPVRAKLPRGAKALRDEAGNLVPVQRLGREFVFLAQAVPAFGHARYKVLSRLPKDARFANVAVAEDRQYYRVDTAHAKLAISREAGTISSYVDKRLCREIEPYENARYTSVDRDLVGYGVAKPTSHTAVTRQELTLNVFQVLDEAPNGMAAWHINSILKEQNLLSGAKVERLEAGPVFARFRATHAFRASKIVEEILVYNAFRRVDFEARIDWYEKGSRDVGVPHLKVSFATAMRTARGRIEGPFTVVEKPADGLEQPTQKFADLTGENFGFTVLNDSKHGCDFLGGRLRLTLLRNGYSPDPETDNGRHVVRFAFAPHGPRIANAELVRSGLAFNRPLLAACTRGRAPKAAANLVIEGSGSVVCTSLRRAEHSPRLLVRLFEANGRACKASVTLGKGLTAAEEVNFLENPTGGKVRLAGGKAHVRFRPFEVKTLRVRCKGFK